MGLIGDHEPKGSPPTYRALSRMRGEAIAYHGVRGYWVVRYVEERHPGFLRHQFSQGEDGPAIERAVIARLGREPEGLWNEIDGLVVDHFERENG